MTPARQLAFAVLQAVETAGGYAGELLHSPRSRGLSPADRRLATELVMGVLRWRAQLDYVIERAARRPAAKIAPEALTALRLGAYQLRFLSRIPANAAVNESVDLAKAAEPHLAGFVNAVLRHLPRDPVAALLAAEPDLRRRREVEFSHPAWLLERWSRHLGPEAAAAIAEYDNQPPPTAAWLDGAAVPEGVALAPGRLLTSAHRVVSGDVVHTAAFQSGAIWLQDEASQLVAHLLEPGAGDTMLDACAAPGGKAALLLRLAPRGRVVALELHGKRARLLRRRIPDPRLAVIGADATRPLPVSGGFDRILVDAPCTGTGTLARNPEIRWRLAPGDPARLAALQTTILANTARALRPGGRLVYSVCSIEPEEGPAVVDRLLALAPDLRVLPAADVLARLRAHGTLRPEAPDFTVGPFLRILPGAAATDGFFAAILER